MKKAFLFLLINSFTLSMLAAMPEQLPPAPLVLPHPISGPTQPKIFQMDPITTNAPIQNPPTLPLSTIPTLPTSTMPIQNSSIAPIASATPQGPLPIPSPESLIPSQPFIPAIPMPGAPTTSLPTPAMPMPGAPTTSPTPSALQSVPTVAAIKPQKDDLATVNIQNLSDLSAKITNGIATINNKANQEVFINKTLPPKMKNPKSVTIYNYIAPNSTNFKTGQAFGVLTSLTINGQKTSFSKPINNSDTIYINNIKNQWQQTNQPQKPTLKTTKAKTSIIKPTAQAALNLASNKKIQSTATTTIKTATITPTQPTTPTPVAAKNKMVPTQAQPVKSVPSTKTPITVTAKQ